MAYKIRFFIGAKRDLAALSAYHRSILRDAIADQLQYEPTVPTRHRKSLDINPFAAWELRVGDWRILYDVMEDSATVNIVAIGRKVHDKLLIRGKEWIL